MKVAIVTSYNSKKPAGLERVLIEQLRGIDKINKKEGIEYIVYCSRKSDLDVVLKKENINTIDVVKIGLGKLWKEIGLFFAPRADVYFFNGPLVPLFFSPKNYYVLVYDFAYKYFGGNSRKERLKNKLTDFLTTLSFKRSKKIVAISNATKDEICKFFNIKKEKIVTIYLGWTAINELTPEKFDDLPESYFMFIGTLKERKNVLRTIEAFAKFKKTDDSGIKFVVVGKKNTSLYVKKLEEVIVKNNIENDVIFTGHVTDGQVAYIYTHTKALVFPSLLEGFGMPPLEAMSFGIPVITSSTTSLGEVAGEAAILVDPENIDNIAGAMEELISDEDLQRSLVEKGRERIKKFSWDASAIEYNNLFKND